MEKNVEEIENSILYNKSNGLKEIIFNHSERKYEMEYHNDEISETETKPPPFELIIKLSEKEFGNVLKEVNDLIKDFERKVFLITIVFIIILFLFVIISFTPLVLFIVEYDNIKWITRIVFIILVFFYVFLSFLFCFMLYLVVVFLLKKYYLENGFVNILNNDNNGDHELSLEWDHYDTIFFKIFSLFIYHKIIINSKN
jgi:hypothetical protein